MSWSSKISLPVRILLGIFCVLIILYAAVMILLGTQWFQHKLKAEAVARLEKLTGGRVEMRELKIQPWILEATVHDLTLHGKESPSQPPLFTAQTLVVQLNPISLLRWRLLLTRFDAIGLEIHVVTYPDGSTNLPGAQGQGGSAVNDLMNLSIGSVNLGNGSLFWNNKEIPFNLAAHRVAILLRYDLQRGYSGSFSCSPVRLRARGKSLPPLTLATSLELSRNGIRLDHLVWRARGVSGKGLLNVGWQPGMHAQATIEAQGDLRPLSRALRVSSVQGGHVRLQCHAAYRNGALTAQGRIEATQVDLKASGFAPGKINLASDFSANEKHVHFAHLRASALGGSFDGQADLKMRKGTPLFNARGRVRGIDAASALQSVHELKPLDKLLPVSAAVSGTGTVSWKGASKGFNSTFDLTFTPPANVPAVRLPITGQMQGSIAGAPSLVFTLNQARLEAPHASLTASGSLGDSQPGLRLHYSTTDFRELEPVAEDLVGSSQRIPLELKSPAVFSGLLTGSIQRPQIQGNIQIGPFVYQGWAWQAFASAVRASSEKFEVATGQLLSGPSSFTFSGSVALDDWKVTQHSAILATVQAAHSPLQGLEDAFGLHYPVTGFVTGKLQVKGTPESLGGTGNFEVSNGSIYQEPFNVLSGQAVITGSIVSLQNVLFRKGQGRMTGQARIDLPHHSFSADFHGQRFSLAEFKRLKLRQSEEEEESGTPGITGMVDFSLQGSGTFTQLQIKSTLDASKLSVAEAEIGNLHAQLALTGKRLQGEGRLQGPSGSVRLTSTISLEGKWDSKFSGELTSLRLDPWAKWMGYSQLQAPVTVSGTFQGDGPLKEPGKISLEAKAQTLDIALSGFELKNTQPVEIRYADHTLHSSPFEMQGPSTQLKIQLAGHFAAPSTISLDASGNANASVLSLLDSSIQAAGNFKINLHAAGSLRQPSLSGRIEVQNLSMRYGEAPLPIAGLNGAIVLKGNRATIESLKSESGQSSIQLSGYATVGAVPRFDLRAQLQHLRLEYPTDFTSLLSGELSLTGSSQAGQLSGEITVGQMFVSQDFNLVNWLGTVGSSVEESPVSASPSGVASKIHLDVHVATSPEVRLSSRTLSFVAAINTTLRGTLAHPVATGNIHIRQGEVLIAGNRYTINRGDITMTSPFQTNPVLDIEATTRVARYNLTIDVTGPIDRTKLSYRSDPPLPNEDILSLLALGYAPQQQMMSSSGGQPFGAVSASALLSQALSSQVSGRVQRIFGVSRIRIDPNLLGPATAGGARVTIEERVARDLTITYSTNTAAAQQRDIRLRWDITNKISLIGERDINGVFGIEVRFHRRLK